MTNKREQYMTNSDQVGMGTSPRTHDNCIHITGVGRPGKTAQDRANGAFERNANNKAKRMAWDHKSNASNSNFPRETCNGKRNRFLK